MHRQTRRTEALRAGKAVALGSAIGFVAVETSGIAAAAAIGGTALTSPVAGAVGAIAGLAVYGLVRLVDD
jgi:hypothetical protein